jgi:protein associated with RNAse G/E
VEEVSMNSNRTNITYPFNIQQFLKDKVGKKVLLTKKKCRTRPLLRVGCYKREGILRRYWNRVSAFAKTFPLKATNL